VLLCLFFLFGIIQYLGNLLQEKAVFFLKRYSEFLPCFINAESFFNYLCFLLIREWKGRAFFPRIDWSLGREAEVMFFNDLNFFISFLDVIGPIFGKPSSIYWSCSLGDKKILDGRIEISFVFFFAKIERYFAESSAF